MKYVTLVALVAASLTLAACSHTAIDGKSGDKAAHMKTYGMDSTGVVVTNDVVEIHAKKHQPEKDL